MPGTECITSTIGQMQLQVERVSQLNDENNRMITEVKGLRKSLENAEHKLHGQTQSLQKTESEVQTLIFCYQDNPI